MLKNFNKLCQLTFAISPKKFKMRAVIDFNSLPDIYHFGFFLPLSSGQYKKMDHNRILPFSGSFYKVGEGSFSHFFQVGQL